MIQRLHLLLTIIFLCISGIAFQAHSTHLMGSDISWKNVGQDSFEVTLTVYRDCNGIDPYTSNLEIDCRNGDSVNLKEDTLVSQGIKDVTRKCDIACSRCSEGKACSFPYGIEEHTFTYLIAFSQNSCKQIHFSYGSTERNHSITTGPAGESYYMEAWFDRDSMPNSPVFKNYPIRLVCKDDPMYFDQGVTYSEDDSLVYEWTPPLAGAATPVSYDAPYSYDFPLEYRGYPAVPKDISMPFGYHLDSLTGQIAFTPIKKQVTVMALKVKIYRDGDLIGETRRDMQVAVDDCAGNNSPTIESPDLYRDWEKKICACDTTQISFKAKDQDNDSVHLTFQGQHLPGNPVFVDSPDTGLTTGSFTWAPPKKALRPTPHQFQITAEDANCPLPGRAKRLIQMTVYEDVKGVIEQKPLDCGFVQLVFNDTNNIPDSRFKYVKLKGEGLLKPGDTIQKQFPPGESEITFTTVNYPCQNTFKDTVKIDSGILSVNAGKNTTVCPGDSISLYPEVFNAQGAVQYSWNTGDTTKNITLDNIQQNTKVVLTITDTTGCSFTDEVYIKTRNFSSDSKPLNLLKDTLACLATQPLTVHTGNRGHYHEWHNQSTSDSLLIHSPGKYHVEIYDSTTGCGFIDSFEVSNALASNGDFLPDTMALCGDTSYLVKPEDTGQLVYWNTGDTTNSLMVDTPGQYWAHVSDSNGCSNTDTTQVIGQSFPTVDLGPDTTICTNQSFPLTTPQSLNHYQWNTGDTTSTIWIEAPGTYSVTATDQYGCSNTDTIQIYSHNTVPNLATSPEDTSFCASDTITMKATSNTGNYLWSTASTDSNIQVTKGGQYWVQAIDSNGCKTTDTINLTTLKDCVWPGDANNDLIANNQDILTIGLTYSQQGPARTNPTIQWTPQKANDWNDSLPSGLNTKFADANGDGQVDAQDTLAVKQNYGKTHQKKGDGLNKKGATPLTINITSDSLYPGAPFEAQISLGTASNTADSIYGLAFTLNISNVVQDDLDLTTQDASNWFGRNNDSFLTFQKAFSNLFDFDVALTRTDQQNISGYGQIATLEGILENELDVEQNTHFVAHISDAVLIQKDGTKVPFELKGVDSAQINPKENSVKQVSEYAGVDIYPNPAKDQITIHIKNDQPQAGQFLNMQGKSVQSFNLRKGNNQVQIEDLASGIYTLRIEMKGHTVNQRMVIE